MDDTELENYKQKIITTHIKHATTYLIRKYYTVII